MTYAHEINCAGETAKGERDGSGDKLVPAVEKSLNEAEVCFC